MRFSDVHGSPRDAKEIIQITCPAFHVKIFMMGRRPDLTLSKRKIVIGMLTAGVMNKQIVRHF